MVFELFSIFCNYPFRHLPLFASTSAIIRFGIAENSKFGRSCAEGFKFNQYLQSGNRVNGSLNVYFQADTGDAF